MWTGMRKWLVITALVIVGAGGIFLAGTRFAVSASARAALKPEDVDRLLAPVALYPDTLLAQMLLCAGDPAQVTRLAKWLPANTMLKGTELQDAATVEGFDPSFVAMALFPQVVKSM